MEKMMKKLIMCTAAVFALSFAGEAMASELCKPYDKSQWLSKEQITEKVKAMGYEVRKLAEEDGCWEVKGMKDGKRVEAYFDPVSAELVKSK
jgi:hypothetical protein